MTVVIAEDYNKEILATRLNLIDFKLKRLVHELDKIITKNFNNYSNLFQIFELNGKVELHFHNYKELVNNQIVFPLKDIILEKNLQNHIITLKNNNCHIKIVIPPAYPFKSPKISNLNGKPYINMLQTPSSYLKRLGYKDSLCLCCVSVTCKNNWYPTSTLFNLFQEIDNYIGIQKAITNLIFCDIIKRKYLYPDAPIMDYLYKKVSLYN